MSGTEINEGGTEPPSAATTTALGAFIVRLIRWWALAGGVLTLGLAFMTAASAISNILFARPFAADHELVKHIIAIAIFMFLPYCQVTFSNVTVDVFTEQMSERGKQAMVAFSSLFAIAFSALLLVQMYSGFAYAGPVLPRRVADGLAALLKRDGFTSVADAVGKDA